jgi:hypothetical protein
MRASDPRPDRLPLSTIEFARPSLKPKSPGFFLGASPRSADYGSYRLCFITPDLASSG